jgi:flavin reductase (DIM6/NTAB) family NADH-FMN oxidoreductase RutF
MEFDIPTLPVRDRHKLLSSVVLPRPIAWVTSMNAAGQVNAAPFSFFNLMGSDPAIVVLGISRSNGMLKDTASNMVSSGEFVIQMVTELLAEQMNQTATDFPHGVNELEKAGLATLPSLRVKPPRIAASPVHMECKYHSTVEIGNTSVLLGEVIHLHIDDAFVDSATLHVHADKFGAVSRMHGGGWYARSTDLFELGRISYKQWQDRG